MGFSGNRQKREKKQGKGGAQCTGASGMSEAPRKHKYQKRGAIKERNCKRAAAGDYRDKRADCGGTTGKLPDT